MKKKQERAPLKLNTEPSDPATNRLLRHRTGGNNPTFKMAGLKTGAANACQLSGASRKHGSTRSKEEMAARRCRGQGSEMRLCGFIFSTTHRIGVCREYSMCSAMGCLSALVPRGGVEK